MTKIHLDFSNKPAVIAAIEQLGTDDLQFLNGAIVDRMKALRSASYTQHMAQFAVGDRVSFSDNDGMPQAGTILKLNKKTVGLITDDGMNWKVAPQLLELETPLQTDDMRDIEPGGRPFSDVGNQGSLPLLDAECVEWVGGRITLPGYVTGEGPAFQPFTLVWLDDQANILAISMPLPDEMNDGLIASLQEAIDMPMIGSPVRPGRVRIDDEQLISPLAQAFPDIEFVHASTPELETLADSMAGSMAAFGAQGSPKAMRWLDTGATQEAIASLFRSAASLYKAAPWTQIPSDQCLIAVSAPALQIDKAAVSIVGQMQQHMGFLLFDSLQAYERYLSVAHHMRGYGSMPDDGPRYSVFSFEQGSSIDADIRKEIAENRWTVASAAAYPELFTPATNQLLRPVTPKDIRLMDALCQALPPLLTRLNDGRDAWSSAVSPQAHHVSVDVLNETVDLTFTTPFPYQQVFTRDMGCSALIAQMMTIDRSSDEVELDSLRPFNEQLLQGYEQSPEAGMTDNQQVSITALIPEFAIDYMNATIATLQPDELHEILFDIVPSKVMIDVADARGVISDVRAFYLYLKREHNLPQADSCLQLLADPAVGELEEALADDGTFGIGKAILHLGEKLGYNTSTQEGMDELVQAMNRGDLRAMDDMPMPGMFMPGMMPFDSMPEPPPSPAKPVNRKTRKNKNKAARKARKKNR